MVSGGVKFGRQVWWAAVVRTPDIAMNERRIAPKQKIVHDAIAFFWTAGVLFFLSTGIILGTFDPASVLNAENGSYRDLYAEPVWFEYVTNSAELALLAIFWLTPPARYLRRQPILVDPDFQRTNVSKRPKPAFLFDIFFLVWMVVVLCGFVMSIQSGGFGPNANGFNRLTPYTEPAWIGISFKLIGLGIYAVLALLPAAMYFAQRLMRSG
jgi:hypothetical protein